MICVKKLYSVTPNIVLHLVSPFTNDVVIYKWFSSMEQIYLHVLVMVAWVLIYSQLVYNQSNIINALRFLITLKLSPHVQTLCNFSVYVSR